MIAIKFCEKNLEAMLSYRPSYTASTQEVFSSSVTQVELFSYGLFKDAVSSSDYLVSK
jgi:hypothetical protein